MNLDERLERDAAQVRRTDGPPPSLDELLDTITDAPRRHRTALWLSAAAAIALAGLIAVLAIRPWSATKTQPGGSPTGTKRLVHIDNFVPSVAVPRTRTTLEVWVPCSATSLGAVVRESTHTVHLKVSGDIVPHAGDTPSGFQCDTAPTRVVVHLSAPLGSRQVTCNCAPRAIPVLDPWFATTAGYLPSSYLPAGMEPINPANNRLVNARYYSRGKDRVLLMEGADAQMPTSNQPVVGHVQVGNHHAVITDADGTCVTWVIRPGVHEGVCSVGTPDSPLSTSEVVRIARDLR